MDYQRYTHEDPLPTYRVPGPRIEEEELPSSRFAVVLTILFLLALIAGTGTYQGL